MKLRSRDIVDRDGWWICKLRVDALSKRHGIRILNAVGVGRPTPVVDLTADDARRLAGALLAAAMHLEEAAGQEGDG